MIIDSNVSFKAFSSPMCHHLKESTWTNIEPEQANLRMLCTVILKFERYYKNQILTKEGWIDFESEIASVIKSLDEDMNEPDSKRISLHSNMGNLSNSFLAEYYSEYTFTAQYIDGVDRKITFKEIRDRLLYARYGIIV